MIAHSNFNFGRLTLLNFAQQVVAAVADGGVAESTRVSHPDMERSVMSVEQRVDDLIAAGRRPLALILVQWPFNTGGERSSIT
jgi:hypothetical protein